MSPEFFREGQGFIWLWGRGGGYEANTVFNISLIRSDKIRVSIQII
jgi:hypothetical protein